MIDAKTIFLMLAIGNILLTVLFMNFLKSNNKRSEWLWTGAKLCEAIAYCTFFFRTITDIGNSSMLLTLGGNFLLYTGFALEAAALWEYRKYQSWARVIIPFLILAIIIRGCAEILGLPANLKITISSYVCGGFFVMATAAFIWRGREATALKRVIIITNSISALVHFARGAMSYFMVDNTLASGNFINIVTYLAMHVFMLSNGFGFLLLVREDEERELLQLATTDSLTELFNRRAFLERADHDLALARRTANPIVMLAFDIDHFKKINDTYGHATGDVVLQAFAQLCRNQLGKSDIIGRTGGEEFNAILTDCTLEDAVQLAENLRQSVEMHIVATNAAEVRFTVSIGLLEFGADETLSAALVRADQALYAAKQSGRNKVVIAEDYRHLAKKSDLVTKK